MEKIVVRMKNVKTAEFRGKGEVRGEIPRLNSMAKTQNSAVGSKFRGAAVKTVGPSNWSKSSRMSSKDSLCERRTVIVSRAL